LAAPDSGLPALNTLNLRGTPITDVGAQTLQTRWPKLQVRR